MPIGGNGGTFDGMGRGEYSWTNGGEGLLGRFIPGIHGK